MILRLEAGKTTIPGCVYGVVGWFPTVVKMRLKTAKTTIPGCVYGVVGWFPTVGIIRLSQPPAGDWLAGAWAEHGKKTAA